MNKDIKAERCVSCGAIIPEGRWICPNCEIGINENNYRIRNTVVTLKHCKLNPCPNCGGHLLKKVHIRSRRLPFWWYIECWNCHWCGKTKLFLWRAKKAWNRKENYNDKL